MTIWQYIIFLIFNPRNLRNLRPNSKALKQLSYSQET
jgi:hypothetical protein